MKKTSPKQTSIKIAAKTVARIGVKGNAEGGQNRTDKTGLLCGRQKYAVDRARIRPFVANDQKSIGECGGKHLHAKRTTGSTSAGTVQKTD